MGVTGLLKALKPITFDVLLPDYKGKTAGVDGHAWLHKAAYGCARAVVKGLKCDTYVNYIMKNIRTLHNCGVTPIVVFDGAPLPMKKEENKKRRQLREQNKEKAEQLEASGDLQGAEAYYQKSISITFQMVMNCVAALKQNNVQYIIAPYEGDSQLAYMFTSGMVDFCITEDSDLLVFGVRNIFTKLNHSLGTGQGINLDRLKTYQPDKKQNNRTDLCNIIKLFRKPVDFVHMAVLSGCDYLNSLRGIGLCQAAKKVKQWKDIARLLHDLRTRKDWTKEYQHDFERATLTYLHQRVYCPKQKKLVHLTPLNDRMYKFISKGKEKFSIDESEMDFLGPKIPPNQAQAIAEARLNPNSRQSVFMPSSKYKIPTFTPEFRQPIEKKAAPKLSSKDVVGKRPEWLNEVPSEKKEKRGPLLAPPPQWGLGKIDDIVSQYTGSSSKRFGLARSRNAFSKTPRSKTLCRDREKSRREKVKSPFQESTMSGSFLSVPEDEIRTPVRSTSRLGRGDLLEQKQLEVTPDKEMDLSMVSPIWAKTLENPDIAPQVKRPDEAKIRIYFTRRILIKSAKKSARAKRNFRKRNKSGVWSFGKPNSDLDEATNEFSNLLNRPLKKQKIEPMDISFENVKTPECEEKRQQVDQLDTSVEICEPSAVVGSRRAIPLSFKSNVDITRVLPDRPLRKKPSEPLSERTNRSSSVPASGIKLAKPAISERRNKKTKNVLSGRKNGNNGCKIKETGKKQRDLLSFFAAAK